MRDLRFDPQAFCSELSQKLEKLAKDSEILSRITPIDWSRFENSYVLKDKSVENLVRLSIFSWYIPREFGILLREEITQIISHREELDFIQLLLEAKPRMLLYLVMTTKWHTRDFFGNVLNEKILRQSMMLLGCLYESKKKPKRTEYRRGYRDKGSLKLLHEYHSFVDSTSEQNSLERQRIVRQQSLLFLRGFLE